MLFLIEVNNAEIPDELKSQIEDENAQYKQKCREYVSSRLGDGPQPKLEFLEYRVS